jgi:L-aspartate oxidase
VFEAAEVVELAGEHGRVVGGWVRRADGRLVLHRASAVLLATGGLGQLFARTTNPKEARGKGLALAWRAGARLADLEFVQFHPTALDAGLDPMPLLTEALRGAGAVLVDEDGERLRAENGSAAELLPRDVVARLLWAALASGRRVLLDARDAAGDSFAERFPTVFEACRAAGLDPRHQPIPIAPAAHYHMGGVLVDDAGRSSVSGLWAAGEVACTGVHGANRLASNSLLEGLVFGARVASGIRAAVALGGSSNRGAAAGGSVEAGGVPPGAPAGAQEALARLGHSARIEAAVRALMWDSVGLVRTEAGLRGALQELEALESQLAQSEGASRDFVAVARLVTTAALARAESRGAHFRADRPAARAAFRKRIVLSRQRDGGLRLEARPVDSSAPERREHQVPAGVGAGA